MQHEMKDRARRIKARRAHRAAMLLATAGAGLIGLARSAGAAGVSLWLDQNGASSGFGSGTVSWDTNTTNDWNTNGAAGNTTAPGKWLQAGQTQGVDDFNIANFNAAFTVNVGGTVDVGGMNFNTGATTIQGTGALNLGANDVTFKSFVNNTNETLLVPINGSGNLTIANASSVDTTINLSGAMSGFTGNLIVAPGTSATQVNKLQMDSDIGGDATKTITLQGFAELGTNNLTTSLTQTFNHPIVLQGTDNWIAGSNGGTTAQRIVTFGGGISGTGNLWMGINNNGGRATLVLGNGSTPQFSYSGNTYVVMASTNGLVQLGQDNILPTATNLVFGPSTTVTASIVEGPFDMNGHNLQINSLATAATSSSSVTVGANIYNTKVGAAPAPVTLTIDGGTGTGSSTFNGVIGQTNVNVNPFNDHTATYTGIQAGTNISVVKNGTTTQIFNNANLYTGNTTVNGGVLMLAKAFGTLGTPGTVTNTVAGNVIVNSGATLATAGGNSTAYWSAAAATGTRITSNGGILSPGGTGDGGATVASTVGGLYANAMTLNAQSDVKLDVFSRISYDSLKITSDLTLDSGTHNIEVVGTPGATGFFTVASFGSLVDPSNAGFALVSNHDPSSFYTYSLAYDNNASPTALILHIQGGPSMLRWDSNTALADAQEGAGVWSTGDNHWIDTSDGTQHVYNNAENLPVTIGDDVTQAGGLITLGSDVRVGGKLTFNPVSSSYTIDGGGASHTDHSLTTSANGIDANFSTTINAPVLLEADQTWNVAASQTLAIGQSVNGNVTLTKANPGSLTFGGSVTVGSLTVNGGVVTMNGSASLGSLTVNGGTTTVNGNNSTIGDVEINNGSAAAFNGSGGNITLVNINSGTLSVGNASALGPESSSFVNIGPASALRITASMNFPNDIAQISSASGQTWTFDLGANNVTFSGVLSLKGNVNKSGTGDWSISGNNTAFVGGSGVGIVNVQNASTLHLLSAHALGTENLVMANNSTLDVPVDSSIGAIRNDIGLLIKTGAGVLTVSGSTGLTAVGANALFRIDQGAVEMDSTNSLGGSNNTNAAPNKQFAITLMSGTELMTKFTGSRDSSGFVFNDNSTLTLRSDSPTGDTEFTSYLTNTVGDVTTFNNFNATATVNGNVTFRNMAQLTVGSSKDLQITMPVIVNSGATLNLFADNNVGNYEQAAVALRGVDNVNAYPGDGLFLQNGTRVVCSGTGDVNIGTTGRGKPIVATGTGAGTGAVLQLGSHTFLRDSGSAADDSTGTASSKLVILNGANLRFEAPMNATYTVPVEDPNNAGNAPSPRTYDGTTGLLGVNTTATAGSSGFPTGYSQIANGFTVLSANRAHNLSRVYQPTGAQPKTPSGMLTLAATDATDQTGLINVGPTNPSSIGLALDNTASSASSNLLYQIDGAADSGNFANFAGLTVQRTSAGTGSVKAQLVSTTKIPTVTLLNGTQIDVSNRKLILTNMALGDVTTQIKNGMGTVTAGQPSWNGSGIVTSQPAAITSTQTTLGTAVASAVNATVFGGMSVNPTDVLVAYAYSGDANLDGAVNALDFNALATNFATNDGSQIWSNGDFNYDGSVNTLDFNALASNFNAAPLPGAPVLGTLVPEPGSIALLTLAGISLARRRRRSL